MENKNKNKKTSQNTDEKLSDEEFKKLIPHLDLHELFLIEIEEDQGTWKSLYDVASVPQSDLIKEIYCAVCSQQIPLNKFKEHIQEKVHNDALNAIDRFYHPLFTASRDSKKDLKDSEIEQKTRKANTIAAAIEAVLKKKPSREPISLSLKDLLSVECQKTKGAKWQKIIIPEGAATEKSKYNCYLCERYCVGIITVNAHLRGHAHCILQHNVFALRAPQNTAVNKYSVLAYDNAAVGAGGSYKDRQYNDAPRKMAPFKDNKQDREGLIGVEFVARLKKQNGEYAYACCLCHKRNIVQTEELMENHLISHKHRRRYCEQYYADTTKHSQDLVKSSGLPFEAGMAFVFSKIAAGIEDYHGYGKPHDVTYDYYLREMNYVAELVEGLPHACQEFGPSFSTVVSINDLAALRNKQEGFRLRYVKTDRARFMMPMRGKNYLNMVRHTSRVLQGKKDNEPSRQRSISSTPSGQRIAQEQNLGKRTHSKQDSVPRSTSPPHLHHSRKRKLDPISEGDNVWRTYRRQISESASGLEQAYLEYRIHPEKHPNYDKEWSVFWKRRKTQLQEEGIDYRSYDFQPEWTTHFRLRLEQLFGEELQSIKIDIRRQLNIPLDAEEDSGFSHTGKHRSLEPPRKRDLREKPHVEEKPPIAQTQAQTRVETQMWNPPAQMERERPNIIGLLRLMTALEDHLGSTGDKILDLLTKALSLEKVYGGESAQLEQNILNANNCRLIKTAQEKLRSQLYADLVESRKINSFNRVIESADVLLNRADSMGWSSIEEQRAPLPTQNIEIEKLIEVLQEKTKYDYEPTAVKKKSLPDTLMELMSQKQSNGQVTAPNKSSNQINQNGQHNYGMYGNTNVTTGLPHVGNLSNQNQQFLPQVAGGGSKLNVPNLQYTVNNSDVWNRLGGQANYTQRNPNNLLGGNPGGLNLNPSAPNVLSNTSNLYGGPNVNSATNSYNGNNVMGGGKYHPFGF